MQDYYYYHVPISYNRFIVNVINTVKLRECNFCFEDTDITYILMILCTCKQSGFFCSQRTWRLK